ncbi:hypothetical protein [Lentilactobacillus sp. Marseille-Q4993]|uniref:hypothetical protein n=1 Tax=Lentilactobacillus sp. Marseille-Q4993 TaxID=3039492 RepID=UPI0024BC8546|nr:hypothetical protein [Lentilactobacillus sp. Marseille-Q4993]
MTDQDRYYQPSNSKDAMRQIEKLFNQYKDAPLTQELVDYNQNLINRLNDDILTAAKQEGIPERIASVNSMVTVMQKWVQMRLAGKPFGGRMEHFDYVSDEAKSKFKRKVQKIKGSSNHRSSRH